MRFDDVSNYYKLEELVQVRVYARRNKEGVKP